MSSDDDKLDEMFSKLNLVSEQEKNMLILIALEELAVDNEGYRNKRNAIIHGLEDGKSLKELIGKNVDDKDKKKILKDHIKEKYNKQLVFFFFIRYLEFNRELFYGHLEKNDPEYKLKEPQLLAMDLANKIGQKLQTASLDELKKKNQLRNKIEYKFTIKQNTNNVDIAKQKKEIKNFINNHDKKESYDNLLNEIETKFNISIEVDVVGIENIGQILHMLHVNFFKIRADDSDDGNNYGQVIIYVNKLLQSDANELIQEINKILNKVATKNNSTVEKTLEESVDIGEIYYKYLKQLNNYPLFVDQKK